MRPDSVLELKGESTLHDFLSKTSSFQLDSVIATSETSSDKIWQKIQLNKALSRFNLSIPVSSLKSDDESLDKNMHEALKMTSFATISFTLTDYQLSPAKAGKIPALLVGKLTIAGVEKLTEIPAEIEVKDLTIQVRGDTKIKMSDFDITPPTMMLGMIKTQDTISLHFTCFFTITAIEQESK
jgi:polyisoprenoid-binding protein YceI